MNRRPLSSVDKNLLFSRSTSTSNEDSSFFSNETPRQKVTIKVSSLPKVKKTVLQSERNSMMSVELFRHMFDVQLRSTGLVPSTRLNSDPLKDASGSKVLTTTFLPSLPIKRKFEDFAFQQDKDRTSTDMINQFQMKKPCRLDMNKIRPLILAKEKFVESSGIVSLPRLTESDYVIDPSIEQIQSSFNEQGQCLVDRFTITRNHYGSITFYGSKINLSGLDLNRLIQIEHGQITVYPNENDRPSQGEQFNCRAIISLFGIYPIDRSKSNNAEEITEPDRLKSINYKSYLQEMTKKFNGKFIDYDLYTGTWKFQVEHF